MTRHEPGPPPVRSVARALGVLEALAFRDDPMTLSDLSRELAIPKSTLLGILRTLDDAGWLEESAGRFTLGVRSLLIGSSYVDSDPVVALTGAWLERLSAELDETVHLGRLDENTVVYLAKRESSHPLRMFSAIGRRLPAHATALGKAILAGLDPAEARRVVGEHPARLTAATLTDPDTLLAELASTRERGWAVDREENTDGIVCFAVDIPVSSTTRDAISVSIPLVRVSPSVEHRAVDLLLQARADLAGPRPR